MKLNIKDKRYLIGVSGGPDSMALLDMARRENYYIEVAHVNYHKRESADRDEELVTDYCYENDIIYHTLELEPDELTGNFQAAARQRRYDFFRNICLENHLDGVLIAHHKDDLIETYLMQMEKQIGVSYYGLKKNNIINGIEVIRPLLKYDKNDLIRYCEENNVPYGIDETNLDNHYQRNRIRHNVVEKMSKQEKDEIIKEINKKNKERELEIKTAKKYLNKNEYEVDEFLNIPYLRTYLRLYFPNKSDKYFDEMLRQLKESDKCKFIGKKWIIKEYDLIKIFDELNDYEYYFNDLAEIELKKYDYYKIVKHSNSFNSVTLSESDFPIRIRNYKQGDTIMMNYGSKKLNRYFIDNKIAYYDRYIWPVVLNKNDEIVLVPGIGCDKFHYSKNPNLFVVKL